MFKRLKITPIIRAFDKSESFKRKGGGEEGMEDSTYTFIKKMTLFIKSILINQFCCFGRSVFVYVCINFMVLAIQ